MSTGARTQKHVGEAGLKAYIRKVFNYMGLSLALTAVASWVLLRGEVLRHLINPAGTGFNALGYLIMLAPLGIVLFMSFNRNLSAQGSKIGLYSIAVLMGMSVSMMALYAGVHNTFQAFLITSVIFGSMSIYGYKTNADLTKMGSILMMAVLGLLIVSLVGLFTGGIGIWFSYAVVGVFTLLIPFNVQQIKNIYAVTGGKGEIADKAAVHCALSLYLNFINIFISLMRILGAADRR
jgi:hypothetical protein